MKIAIVRLSSLGDVVVCASLLPFIHTLSEEIEVDWYVDSLFAEVLRGSPCITNLYEINLKKGGLRALPGIIKRLKSAGFYDVVIDMQGLMKSALVGRFLNKQEFWGFAWDSIKEPLASVCYDKKVHIAYEENILKRNLKLVSEALGVAFNSDDLALAFERRKEAFGVSDEAKYRISELLGQWQWIKQGYKRVILVLEASIDSKTYPPMLFVELIKALFAQKIGFFLLSHKTQRAAEIKVCFEDEERVVSLPALNMDELKALMEESDLLIGGDTGVTHLAWAMQRPSITLYGNTPASRFALIGEANITLSGSENPTYDKSDFSIANITPQSICAEAKRILQC